MKGKRETPEEIELPSQENISTLGEKQNYKYQGILGAKNMKQMEMKEKERNMSEGQEKIRKEYLRRTRKCLERKFYNKN